MKFFISAAFVAIATLIFFCCQSEEQKGERLAHKYCGSCHLFPEPGLLDKGAWEQGVLPQMAFRMGFQNMKISLALPPEDLELVYKSLPAQPLVTEEEWRLIKNYYLKSAPDSLVIPTTEKPDSTLALFNAESISISNNDPLVTLLRTDTVTKKIFAGTRSSMLYQYNNKFVLEDTFKLNSPPSSILFGKQSEFIISTMGIMDPNDQAIGEILRFKNNNTPQLLVDSLKRPVFIEQTDLNNDKQADFIVCEFGNYTGALTAYKNMGDDQYEKHTIYGLPGARKIIVRDVNNDGLMDLLVLMTQGDEQIALLTNSGNFNFRITTLLRFPPVYGSSFMDIADFNHDGNFDILYTNGDNADYSTILKPYHGVRVFMNDGKNKFSESWFYNMHGASQALARDFDGDGDMDIAAISFFPDFNTHPEEGFIYFENDGKTFKAHTTPVIKDSRWLVMDAADVDQDGDCDLLLGALNFPSKVPPELYQAWGIKKTSILYLKNKKIQ